jgi:uncharacterized membrane protein
MSPVHLHLMLNHLPVVGTFIGVLLLAVALLRRSSELAKVTLGLFALLGAASLAVFLTGEPAEELVEKLPGFSESITHAHEEVAELATIVMVSVGVLALGALVLFRRRALPRWVTAGALALAVVTGGLMGYTGYLGGQVRHTEVRGGAVASATGEQSGSAGERAEHDKR